MLCPIVPDVAADLRRPLTLEMRQRAIHPVPLLATPSRAPRRRHCIAARRRPGGATHTLLPKRQIPHDTIFNKPTPNRALDAREPCGAKDWTDKTQLVSSPCKP